MGGMDEQVKTEGQPRTESMVREQHQLSSVERIKAESDYLRGGLLEELANDHPSVSADSEQLLKFHGVYAQDNRDVRRERTRAHEPLDYIFMVRVAIPGGHLRPDQWLTLDRVADEIANGTIRLTTRQAVQFHGVRKAGLQPLGRELDAQLMTSFAACGDVVRNIVSCPALEIEDTTGRTAAMTAHLARTFKPKTQAHWEIFVAGERTHAVETSEEHDFYGDTYLPRKFKIAIANATDNCVDVFGQDVGLIPGAHPEVGPGFSVVVGGGLGRSYAHPETFARLADPLTFVAYDETEGLVRAILAAFRDLGGREDRRRARMKYIVADRGLDVFREEVESRLGTRLRPPIADFAPKEVDDHLGWRTQPSGDLQLGIRVSAGRVRDLEPGRGLKSALGEIAKRYPVQFYVTAQQDLIIADLPRAERSAIDALFAHHAVRMADQLGPVERTALACPALPTCGQALAESERRLPDVVALVEGELQARGLAERSLQLRMTGCPNGCARPAVAEVGIVGRTKTAYDVYLGGSLRGDRLASLHQESVKLDQVPALLGPLFDRWRDEGYDDEPFGDFYVRVLAK